MLGPSSSHYGSLALPLLLLLQLVISLSGLCRVEALKDDTPTCRDEEGNPIDWFIAYKFPTLERVEEPYASGAGYAYIAPTSDSAGAPDDNEAFLSKFREVLQDQLGFPSLADGGESKEASGWTIAKHRVNHEDSMIMRSLAAAYSPTKGENLNWIFYNDHPAKHANNETKSIGPSQTRAHAKGAVLIDEESGDAMWLSHTVPRFPTPAEDPLKYPETGYMFGQTFVCLNFDAKTEGSKVARHLSNMFALIYNSNITPKLRRMIPELEQLKLEGERSGLNKKERVAGLDQTFTTRGGKQFELFSKSSSLQGDLYAAWLAEKLDSSLYVETWRKGAGDPLVSDCPEDKHQVNNIKVMKLVSNSTKLFSWPYFQDHSKWAMTATEERGVVCLADINRMASQFKRGGGAICVRDPKVWTVFSGSIQKLEPCKVKTAAKSKIPSGLSEARKQFVEKVRQSLL